jgi:beta-lactamase superfamily II metal-dependent hydrolase
MTCEIAFLPVGNADSIIIRPDTGSAIIVDLHKFPLILEWLNQRQETNINRIYITHEHRDHFPKIEDLVTFLKDWLKTGTIGTICLPYEAYKNAKQKVISNRDQNKRLYDRLLLLIEQWEKQNIIKFLEPTRNDCYLENDLQIKVLHPNLLYAQDHLVNIKGKHNEISLILRVNYGNFSAILLADIEGDGLTELIEIYQDDLNKIESELKADIVKIPHHGAYPKNGDDLEKLLRMIDAEIAVLSVGSTNTYNHVKPELFALLCQLKNDQKLALNKFICTEVTKTCVYSTEKCQKMGKQGLSEPKKCAGEITIIAENHGEWELKTETDHDGVISELSYPACKNIIDNNGVYRV